MKDLDLKPFLDWAKENLTETALDFTLECVRDNHITGIWGYLLMFFDSVGIKIIVLDMPINHKTTKWVFDIEENKVTTPYHDKDFTSRSEAQTEAIKEALEILTKKP